MWDDAVHAPLFVDHTKDWYSKHGNYSKCPEALLNIAWIKGRALAIVYGNKICNHKRRYVCLKPASKCGQASALVGKSSSPIGVLGGLIGGSIAVVVVGLVVFAVKHLKKNSKKIGENVLPVFEDAV